MNPRSPTLPVRPRDVGNPRGHGDAPPPRVVLQEAARRLPEAQRRPRAERPRVVQQPQRVHVLQEVLACWGISRNR